jgi:penicillin-binding protein-related factor A (putative recombinase)
MTPEGKVKAKLDRELKKRAAFVWYFKPVSSGMGKHGVPDYILCVAGQFVAFEVKADATKEPTKLQKIQLKQIDAADGVAWVVHKDNIDDALAMLDEMLEYFG